MDDLNELTTPVLQDWWERYVCPTCMSRERESRGLCADRWHSVPAVTYECPASAFSPLSIPEAELQGVASAEKATVAKYGRVWTRSNGMGKRRLSPAYV